MFTAVQVLSLTSVLLSAARADVLANIPDSLKNPVLAYYDRFLPRPEVSPRNIEILHSTSVTNVTITYSYHYFRKSIPVDPRFSIFIKQLDLIRQKNMIYDPTATIKTDPTSGLENQVLITNGKISQQTILHMINKMKRGENVTLTEVKWPLAVDVLSGKSAEPQYYHGAVTTTESPVRCSMAGVYRGMDGVCNNPEHPTWGSAGTDLIRILPPTYIDGLMAPRVVKTDGSPLPPAREVSTAITQVDDTDVSQLYTTSVVQWGQFIAHDLTLVPVQRPTPFQAVDCCNGEDTQHLPECFPIDVPSNDPLYQSSTKCLNFMRSVISRRVNMRGESAQQVNKLTHFLDGSQIYGSSELQLKKLRAGNSAFLLVSGDGDLPHTNGSCAASRGENFCFAAGDDRVNEQPTLAVIHKIWVRLHNLIAQQLHKLNPTASSESVFQETRAIVVALLQKIVYKEWLPVVLGPSRVSRFNLGSRAGYAVDVNPSIVNEFATAVMRFGHSAVRAHVSVNGTDSDLLSNTFFKFGARISKCQQFLALISSITRQAMQKVDTKFNGELAGKLFRGNKPLGLDLVALNIQRGRDHGLATFTQLRNHLATVCDDVTPVKNWADLKSTMTDEKIKRLKDLYGDVTSIDLYVGGLSENRVSDGILGPTFSCMMADQFLRTKYGDRHFYNHLDSLFTDSQLSSIDSTTWAGIICMTTGAENIQSNAFKLISESNKLQSCHTQPTIDLNAWKSVLPRKKCNCLTSQI